MKRSYLFLPVILACFSLFACKKGLTSERIQYQFDTVNDGYRNGEGVKVIGIRNQKSAEGLIIADIDFTNYHFSKYFGPGQAKIREYEGGKYILETVILGDESGKHISLHSGAEIK